MKNDFLKKMSLFSHLSSDELNVLAASLEKHTYLKGEEVFQEGDTADRLYIVYDGSAKIFKSSLDGKEHTLRVMQKHDLIGEVPMFEGGTYPASCTAITDAVLFSIFRPCLLGLIQDDPSIALNMLALQAKRLKEFTLKIEKLTLQKTEQRLADFFIKKAETLTDNRIHVDFNDINIQNLADYLGVSRENVSRIISKWVKLKIISKQQRNIIIQDFHSLGKIAAYMPVAK